MDDGISGFRLIIIIIIIDVRDLFSLHSFFIVFKSDLEKKPTVENDLILMSIL